MVAYIIRRIFIMIPTLVAISIISFIIIQLPPGDFLTTYIANRAAMGEPADEAEIEALRLRFGLDQPLYKQYLLLGLEFLARGYGPLL